MVHSSGKIQCPTVAVLCFFAFALALVSAQSDAPPKWTPTWTDRLKKDLLKDYDPSIRPSQHYNVTTVEIGMTITHVEINEIKSTMSVYGWMKFNWTDPRLAWNPELYENKTSVYMNQSSIWFPLKKTSILVKVTSAGEVQYAGALQKENRCAIQWQKWPFDTQHCKMLVSPWVEHEDIEIQVKLIQNALAQGTVWQLVDVTLLKYSYTEQNVSLAQRGTQLQFALKRNSRIYRSTIIAPACILILMNLLSFWIPPNGGEKLVLNAINVLVACMFLKHFNEYLSFYTSSTPSIVLFYSFSLYLAGICLLMTVLLESMLKNSSKKPVPWCIKSIISHDVITCMISGNKTKHTWNDPKLTWNPASYGYLDVVRLDPTIVWRPDVVLYNNAGGSDNHHYGDTNVLVYSAGKVLWVPPTEYHAFCELNMRLWPFDYQKCIVKIGSWTFDGYKLNLTVGGQPELETLVKNSEWKILKVDSERHTTFYPCCTEPYIDITYNVTLQRQSDTHRAIVVIPALVIIMFALSVFWMPLQAGERTVMNGIIALMITLFLIYFAQQLPAISGQTPLIVIFFSNTLLLTAFSTMISVVVLNMTKTKHERSLPALMKRVAGAVGPFVGVGKKHFSFSDKGNVTIESSTEHEWFKFGLVLNRLSFIVFCAVFVICAFYAL